MKSSYAYGLGRRKRAIAQVKLLRGSGKFSVNTKEQPLPDYVRNMFTLVGEHLGAFDLQVKASGGGITGWKGAISLGLARALIELKAEHRGALKAAKLLTRDPREKERKKYGLKRARRAPQFSKR